MTCQFHLSLVGCESKHEDVAEENRERFGNKLIPALLGLVEGLQRYEL